jgi:hypothetical protein
LVTKDYSYESSSSTQYGNLGLQSPLPEPTGKQENKTKIKVATRTRTCTRPSSTQEDDGSSVEQQEEDNSGGSPGRGLGVVVGVRVGGDDLRAGGVGAGVVHPVREGVGQRAPLRCCNGVRSLNMATIVGIPAKCVKSFIKSVNMTTITRAVCVVDSWSGFVPDHKRWEKLQTRPLPFLIWIQTNISL